MANHFWAYFTWSSFFVDGADSSITSVLRWASQFLPVRGRGSVGQSHDLVNHGTSHGAFREILWDPNCRNGNPM